MTFLDVIEKWPSTKALSLDVGAKHEAVKQWRKRNSIPATFWLPLEEAARRKGIEGVTLFTLAEIAAADRVQA